MASACGGSGSAVVYHNPRCSTSRKALELLHAFGIGVRAAVREIL